MLRAIEKTTRQTIEPMRLPSSTDIANKRTAELKDRITQIRESQDLAPFVELLSGYQQEHDIEMDEIAAALAFALQEKRPVIAQQIADQEPVPPRRQDSRDDRGRSRDDRPQTRYQISVGKSQGVTPRHIVGALANEGGINARAIGAIELNEDTSTVDLDDSLPRAVIERLGRIHLFGTKIGMMPMGPAPKSGPCRGKPTGGGRKFSRNNDRLRQRRC